MSNQLGNFTDNWTNKFNREEISIISRCRRSSKYSQPERLLVATFHAQNASWKPHKKFLYTAVIFLVSREKHCLLLHIIVCACPGKSFRKAQKMSSYVGKNHSLKVPKTFSALRRKRFLREELKFCCFFHVCFFVLCKYVVITSLLGS